MEDCVVDINLRNVEGKTALDVAKDAEVKAELLKWNASRGIETKTSGYSGDDYAEISDEECWKLQAILFYEVKLRIPR